MKLKEFPALKSLSSRPQNLPSQLTPFIERPKDLAAIAQFLAAPGQRLLTLRGPGGCGKTRLALQAGQLALSQFKHGVCFAALESVASPEGLLPALASALKLSLYEKQDLKSQLIEYLREKQLLLILDNFDQLLAAAGLLQELLQGAPQLKVLATSRARLNQNSESVQEVAGMEEGAAQQLFLQRARKVKADFAPLPPDKEALQGICRELEGLPLALEMAAAWCKTLPLKEILRRLEGSVALLVSSEKDLPERQRSMRAVFDYSWKLLSLDEQKLLRGLSVFAAGCSATAAEAVAQAGHAQLKALVDKSLLRVAGEGRYQLHSTMQPFALAKLDALPAEKLRIGELHAQYYFKSLKAKEPQLRGAGQAAALAQISADFGNVKRAWKHALEKGRIKLLFQGARGLALYAELKGHCGEWLPQFEKALALFHSQQPLDGASPEEAQRAQALLAGIAAEWRCGQGLQSPAECAKVLEKCAQNLKRLQAKEEAAYMQLRGCLYEMQPEAKAAALQEAASVFRLASDKHGENAAKAVQGAVLWEKDRNPEGKRMLEECLVFFKEQGNLREQGNALQALGCVAMDEEDGAGGLKLFRQAKELYASLGGMEEAGWALLTPAELLGQRGDWAAARPLFEEALAFFEPRRLERGMRRAASGLSSAYASLGDWDKALALCERVLDWTDPQKDGGLQRALGFQEKAAVLLRQGKPAEALSLAVESRGLLQGLKQGAQAAAALELQGDIQLELGQAAQAKDCFKNAQLEFSQAGPEWKGRRGWALAKQAEAESRLNALADSKRNFGRALSLADSSHAEDFALASAAGLASLLLKEKKLLDALRLLLMVDRLRKGQVSVSQPRAHEAARSAAAALLNEASSKLMQNVADDSRAWAKATSLAAFYKECVAKYCA